MSELTETEQALARSMGMTGEEWRLWAGSPSDVTAEAEQAHKAAAAVDQEEAVAAERARRAAA